MALLTPAGTVVEVNQTALEWSQITPPDIEAIPTSRPPLGIGIERAAAGQTVRAEHEMRGSGQVRAVVDFSLKPVPGERGEPIWLVAEGRDITELKRAQDALRQAQKLEAIGQLTGGVAHDFNNLLTIIKSSTDLLRKPGLPEERRRRYVDAIADTVDRASKLTGQLLAFARRQALKPEVFDPAQRVRSIIDMLRTIVGAPILIAIEIGCEGGTLYLPRVEGEMTRETDPTKSSARAALRNTATGAGCSWWRTTSRWAGSPPRSSVTRQLGRQTATMR